MLPLVSVEILIHILLFLQMALTRQQCLCLIAAGSLFHFFLDHLFEVMPFLAQIIAYR